MKDVLFFIGGLLFAWFLSWRSSRSQKRRFEALTNQNDLMLRAMEEAVGTEFNKDSQDKIVGIVKRVKAKVRITGGGSAKLTVERGGKKDPQPPV